MASQADVRASDNAIEAQQQAGAAQDPAWWGAVDQFKQAAAAMEGVYSRLIAARDYVASRPELADQWSGLVDRAGYLRAVVEDMRDKIASAVAWTRSITSSLGLSGGLGGIGGLGILPVLAIAAIAAAVAMLGKWTTDTVRFLKTVEEQRRLEAAGVEPERAAEIVAKTAASGSGGGFSLFNLGGLSTPLIVALALGGGVLWWRYRRGR